MSEERNTEQNEAVETEIETETAAAEHSSSEDHSSQESQQAEAEAQIEMELEEERKKVEELTNRLLRIQADFDNFRRRTQKEREDLQKYASRSLLEKLLPAVDNLERAIQSAKQSENVDALAQGVEMVYRQMMEALETEGATPIDSLGKPFDPYFHQAVMQVDPEEGQESGIVVEEFQKGYILKDKVIRPAMVKVTS